MSRQKQRDLNHSMIFFKMKAIKLERIEATLFLNENINGSLKVYNVCTLC